MPGFDGYECARRLDLETATAVLPIVLMSGAAEPVDRVRALRAGAVDFLSKPVAAGPQENFNFLNSYLQRMNPFIWENGGFVDKYIGDAIMALASRLEQPTRYSYRFLDKMQVRGKLEPVSVFEMFDGDPEELAARKARARETFEKAVYEYHRNNFAETDRMLSVIPNPGREDIPLNIYRERCASAGR
jgi:class 3 adenylate cyclase